MTQFYWVCFSAASDILRALALGLALEDEDHLLRLHSGHYNQLRLLHYPPIFAHAVEDGSMARMPAHTDWSSMTMLFQDDSGGLEIEDPHTPGRFVAAQPMRGALVMNVGDLLMRWSNGEETFYSSFPDQPSIHLPPTNKRIPPMPVVCCHHSRTDSSPTLPDRLKSTSHRVTLPPRQHPHSQSETTKPDHLVPARYSIAYFLTTDPDRLIECLPACCVDKEEQAGEMEAGGWKRTSAKYEPITQREYAAMRARVQY